MKGPVAAGLPPAASLAFAVVEAAMTALSAADATPIALSQKTKHLRSRIMSNKLFNNLAQAALALLCLGTTIAETNAGSFTRGCAARDLQILMLIEYSEDANSISQQKVTQAIETMMHAPIVCHEGRVVDALKIYDAIAQTFTSDSVLPAPTH
jgi:hypothetical protein